MEKPFFAMRGRRWNKLLLVGFVVCSKGKVSSRVVAFLICDVLDHGISLDTRVIGFENGFFLNVVVWAFTVCLGGLIFGGIDLPDFL